MAAAPIEREHLHRPELLAVWVRLDEGLELAGERCMPSLFEVEVEARLEGGEAGLL